MVKNVTLNCEELLERGQAHLYLEKMLELPDYYGRNLDALYDCLTELGECHIVLKGAAILRQSDSYGEKVLKVFQDAARSNFNIRLEIQE